MTLFFFNILFSPNKQNVVGALLYVFLFIFIFVEHHYYRKKKKKVSSEIIIFLFTEFIVEGYLYSSIIVSEGLSKMSVLLKIF